ncbi:MAG: hypothetical protein AB7F75_06055 [Planctomycetota bacterium]
MAEKKSAPENPTPAPAGAKKNIEDFEPAAYTEVSEYKGNPIITIHGGMRPFGFGLRKAELILEVVEDIKAFVVNQKKTRGES